MPQAICCDVWINPAPASPYAFIANHKTHGHNVIGREMLLMVLFLSGTREWPAKILSPRAGALPLLRLLTQENGRISNERN